MRHLVLRHKGRRVLASAIVVIAFLAFLTYSSLTRHFHADTYINTSYGSQSSTPISLMSPNTAPMQLSATATKTVENLGGFMLQSNLRYNWMYREPDVDGGQPHLLEGYWTNNSAGLPINQLYDINLATGQYRETSSSALKGMSSMIMGPNGKLYFGYGTISEYDPHAATPTFKVLHTEAKSGGASMSFVPPANIGGKLVMYVGENYAAYLERGEYDATTDSWSWSNLGVMDDPTLRGAVNDGQRFIFGTYSRDDRYVFMNIRDQAEGWEIVGYDRQTGDMRRFWPGSSQTSLSLNSIDGKIWASYTDASGITHPFNLNDLSDPVELTGSARTPPSGGYDANGTSAKAYTGVSQSWFNYAVDESDADAYGVGAVPAAGSATIKVRHCVGSATNCTDPWTVVNYNDVSMAPSALTNALPYSSDELLIRGNGYGPYATINPYTKTVTKVLGTDSLSMYRALYEAGKWYFVGYPQLALDVWDPIKAWIKPSLGGISSATNPQYLLSSNDPDGVLGKYNYYITNDDQGTIYVGIHHQRENSGGSIAWYNPSIGVTSTVTGLRAPFVDQDIRDLISVDGGTKLVYSSIPVTGTDARTTDFVIDAHTKQIIAQYDLTKWMPATIHGGPMIEVEPGVILGATSGYVYKLNIDTGQMEWVVGEPTGKQYGTVPIWDRQLVRGPDGYVWLYIDSDIYRIDPRDGSIQDVIANAGPAGVLTFFNNDLYITGGTTMRRVSKLFVTATRSVPTPAPVPTVTMTIDGQSLVTKSPGDTAVLTWSSANATNCTASGGWSGAKTTSGNETISAITETTIYSISCTGSGGVASANVTAAVNSPTPSPSPATRPTPTAAPTTTARPTPTAAPTTTVTMTIDGQSSVTKHAGDTVALAWNSVGMTTCSASGNWSGSKSTSGAEITSALTSSAVYSLICEGDQGAFSNNVRVTITSPSALGTVYPPLAAVTSDNVDSATSSVNNSEPVTNPSLDASSASSSTSRVATSTVNPTPVSSSTPTATSTPQAVSELSANKNLELNVSVSHIGLVSRIVTTMPPLDDYRTWHYKLVVNDAQQIPLNYFKSWLLSLINGRPTTSVYLVGDKFKGLQLRIVAYDRSGQVVASSAPFTSN